MQNIGNIFAGVNSASFVGLDTLTDVKLKGGMKNPQQGHVQKLVRGSSVMVFQNKKSNAYENMVQRRLQKEGKNPGNFQLSPRTWGERIPDSPFIRHEKDGVVKYYLEVIFLKAGSVEYLLDGQPIDKSQIEGLQEQGVNPDGQGGLDDKVIIRTYAIDSLTRIRIDGQEHVGPFYC